MSPSLPPLQPGAAPDSRIDAQRLLGIVQGLARELRPHAPEVEHLGLDHSLERDFGLDSLARTELLARIERELGARLDEQALTSAETPRDLLKLTGIATSDRVGTPPEPPGGGPPELTRTPESDRPPDTVSSLIELLDWHAATHGDRVHITLYGEGESTEDIRYGALQAQAMALAAGLQQQGLGAGDKVAVMLPTGREFFAAFYGALYAGCIPVPLYPPARPAFAN